MSRTSTSVISTWPVPLSPTGVGAGTEAVGSPSWNSEAQPDPPTGPPAFVRSSTYSPNRGSTQGVDPDGTLAKTTRQPG